MISQYLLPNRIKIFGWIILLPSFIMGILWICGIQYEIIAPVFAIWGDDGEYFTIIEKNIYNEIIAVPLLTSLIIVSFAKEKNEDEYLTKIRLESLTWSIYINSFLLLCAWIFVFRDGFYNIMIYNMFTVLLLFVVKFHYTIFINSKTLEDEK
jgi:hypothetical protein